MRSGPPLLHPLWNYCRHIRAIWLALSSEIYSQIALYSVQLPLWTRIFLHTFLHESAFCPHECQNWSGHGLSDERKFNAAFARWHFYCFRVQPKNSLTSNYDTYALVLHMNLPLLATRPQEPGYFWNRIFFFTWIDLSAVHTKLVNPLLFETALQSGLEPRPHESG